MHTNSPLTKKKARDLLQDTTLKALDNEEKYVDNVNFKGWIFTIMRNIFINNYRQTVRKATVIDQTESISPQHFPRLRSWHSGRLLCCKGNLCCPWRIYRWLSYPLQYVCRRIQIQRNRRENESSARHYQKSYLFRT